MKLPKIKVYFWHLVIMFIAILGAFYYIYKDMKRMETNMLGLFMRCNAFDKFINKSSPTVSLPEPVPEPVPESESNAISTESLPDLIPVEIPVEISEVKDVKVEQQIDEEEFIDSDDSEDSVVEADIVDSVLNVDETKTDAPVHDRSTLLRMTNAQLKDILVERGIVISGAMNKNKLVSLILGESE